MTKAGRKRKFVKRQPNGQPSRIGQAGEIKKTAVEARQRVYSMSKEDAELPISTDPIGMLARLGQQGGGISKSQANAALQYEEDRREYLKAIEPPKDAGCMDLNKVTGRPLIDEHAQMERAKKTIRRYNKVTSVIQEAQNSLRGRVNLFGALDAIVMRKQAAHHLIGDLRVALNALVRHYGLERRAA